MSARVPVKAVPKERRAGQAAETLQAVVSRIPDATYTVVGDSEYKWWLMTTASNPSNEELIRRITSKMLEYYDARFMLLWQQAVVFLQQGNREACFLFVEQFFKALCFYIHPSAYNIGPDYKVRQVVARPYQFNDNQFSEVI